MANASRTGAKRPYPCLPEEILVWEIFMRLAPKSLLRCRAVCRDWSRPTFTPGFLLAHHSRQPSLPIVWGELVSTSEHTHTSYEDFLVFDHQAAELRPVARFDVSYCVEGSCDGLLILCKHKQTGVCFSVCNPVTREHAPIGASPWDFSLIGMYLHRPTGEYRLLLHRMSHKGTILGSLLPKDETGIGCYVFALGSDQPPRYIGGPEEAATSHFLVPALLHDSLHWFPRPYQRETILVFDTTTESFRQMRAPIVPTGSDIFEMDGKLGIYYFNNDAEKVVDIWVLQNYKDEVWDYKYQVKFPVTEIRRQFGTCGSYSWYVSVVWGHGDVVLMVGYGGRMFYVNTHGELVDCFRRDGQQIYAWELRLKQTLVPHNFLAAPEDYAANESPFL